MMRHEEIRDNIDGFCPHERDIALAQSIALPPATGCSGFCCAGGRRIPSGPIRRRPEVPMPAFSAKPGESIVGGGMRMMLADQEAGRRGQAFPANGGSYRVTDPDKKARARLPARTGSPVERFPPTDQEN
jgi:hypothetical protein